MAKQNQDFGQTLVYWEIPEIPVRQRGPLWYLITGLVSLGLIVYGVYTHNYLFVFLIVLFLIIAIIGYFRHPEIVGVEITTEGVLVDTIFYDFDMVKNFSVIYKPREDVKAVYLEFVNLVRPRLTIPLGEANPVQVREELLKYVLENLERTDEPNTDFISKKLKL